MEQQMTHVDPQGAARMVDVGEKPISRRVATAAAACGMSVEAASAIRQNSLKKGDVIAVARLAAIGAAKRTDELIPLCHSVPLDVVNVDFQWRDDTTLVVSVTAVATGRTGVEMEAMLGASVGALTVYDMCKAIDRSMTISEVVLLSKAGGIRGDYRRQNEPNVGRG